MIIVNLIQSSLSQPHIQIGSLLPDLLITFSQGRENPLKHPRQPSNTHRTWILESQRGRTRSLGDHLEWNSSRALTAHKRPLKYIKKRRCSLYQLQNPLRTLALERFHCACAAVGGNLPKRKRMPTGATAAPSRALLPTP